MKRQFPVLDSGASSPAADCGDLRFTKLALGEGLRELYYLVKGSLVEILPSLIYPVSQFQILSTPPLPGSPGTTTIQFKTLIEFGYLSSLDEVQRFTTQAL
jgi:hypothetical protein